MPAVAVKSVVQEAAEDPAQRSNHRRGAHGGHHLAGGYGVADGADGLEDAGGGRPQHPVDPMTGDLPGTPVSGSALP